MMKLLIALLFSIPFLANADLSYEHYMNIVKGDYKIVFDPSEQMYTDSFEFSLSNKGKVTFYDDNQEGTSNTFFFENPIGPIGLPTTTIMAYYYSDEQTEGYNITLTAQEGDPSKVLVQSVIFTANDGPNEWTFVERLQKYKLYKKSKTDKYIKIERF